MSIFCWHWYFWKKLPCHGIEFIKWKMFSWKYCAYFFLSLGIFIIPAAKKETVIKHYLIQSGNCLSNNIVEAWYFFYYHPAISTYYLWAKDKTNLRKIRDLQIVFWECQQKKKKNKPHKNSKVQSISRIIKG